MNVTVIEYHYEGNRYIEDVTTLDSDDWLMRHNLQRDDLKGESNLDFEDIKEMFSMFSQKECQGYGNKKVYKFLTNKGYNENDIEKWFDTNAMESEDDFITSVFTVKINKETK
jgi:hypothetical protein